VAYTTEQLLTFRATYRRRRRRLLVLFGLVMLASLALLLLYGERNWNIGFAVGVAGLIVLAVIDHRCPACRKYLGSSVAGMLLIRQCPKCGVTLVDQGAA